METEIIPIQPQNLLTSLCKNASLCRMRLSAFYECTAEFVESRGEKKEAFSGLSKLFFESTNDSISEIMQLSWTTNYNHNLQNEIRSSLLSSHRDRHDEIYFLLIKKVLTDLQRCQHFCIAMSLYHKGFNFIFKDGMTEELVKPAMDCAMKLAPGFYKWHLLDAICQLKKLIEGVIPPNDLCKVLPTVEIANAVKAGSQLAASTQQLCEEERTLGVEREKSRANVEELKKASEDITKSTSEREKAAKDVYAIENALLQRQIGIQERKVALSKEEARLRQSTAENRDKVADDSSKNLKAPLAPEALLGWNGSKTDLAELIWTIGKSKRITNTSTGKLVTITELTRQFEALFGITINVTGLMQGRKDSYKSANDGLTFMAFLSEQVDRYIADQ